MDVLNYGVSQLSGFLDHGLSVRRCDSLRLQGLGIIMALLCVAGTGLGSEARPADAGAPPRLGGISDSLYNFYVGNLHSHTSYSDGKETPAVAFEYARDVANIDFLAVTDHHHMLTAEEYDDILYQADVFTEDGVFVGIGGQEWTGQLMNHSTVFDADYVLTVPINDYESLYTELAIIGCTANFCHPRPHNFGYFEYSAVGDISINGVEVRTIDEEACYIQILNNGWRVGTDGSQDNHGPNWGNGWCWTMALACSLTRHEILEATRNHRTYSTLDRNLEMLFRAEGHYMGDEFAHTDNIDFSIEVYDPDPGDVFKRLELFQNGEVIQWIDLNTESYTWTPSITPPSGENHYFVKAYQISVYRAWSAPIWIDCTTNLPSTPRPELPYDGQIVASLTPDFCWHPSEDAVSYTLDVSESQTFPIDPSTYTMTGITDTFCTFADSLDDDVWYYYKIRSVNQYGRSTYSGTYSFLTDEDASSVAAEDGPSTTIMAALSAQPNPFRDGTSVEFIIERPHHVSLSVYDVKGRMVRTLFDGAAGMGRHMVHWDGADSRGRQVAPGVYLLRIEAGGSSAVRKAAKLR
jgi:hypothetical protein